MCGVALCVFSTASLSAAGYKMAAHSASASASPFNELVETHCRRLCNSCSIGVTELDYWDEKPPHYVCTIILHIVVVGYNGQGVGLEAQEVSGSSHGRSASQ